MKNKILILFLLSTVISASAQKATLDTFEDHLKSSLLSYYKNYPQEKVFVQTNQPYYTNGETIWYKVYTMAYGKPSGLSKIIYVQLSDTAGNIITQNKLPLINGVAHGNIDIGQKVKTGWYMLRSFTSWMMNFGPENYYNQRIYIRNLADSPVPDKQQTITPNYHIKFYPEGGDLLNGTFATIAFKAYSDDGLPAKVTGTIKDNSGKKVADLTTTHDGMGEFTLETLTGNDYTASVLFPNGSMQEVKLPTAKENGIYLQALQTQNTVQLKIAFAGPEQKFANCVLAASQNSGQVVTYPLQLVKGTNVFELKKETFTTGILRLTIFDANGLPQAERIVFVNNHDLQAPVLKADTLSVAARGHNSFSIMLKDKAGLPVKGNFSVAITDGDAFEEGWSNQNIFSALLISPELQGEIHDPGYYFKNQDDSLAHQLDLVMLTNGWRHFSWQKILTNEKLALTHPVEHSQYIVGKITNYKPPIADKDNLNIKLLIMNADSTKFIGSVTPDNTGSFILKDFNHSGLSDIYIQTTDNKKHIKKSGIKIATTLSDSLKEAKAELFKQPAVAGNFTNYYISGAESEANSRLQADGILLNTVNIKGSKILAVQKLVQQHVSSKYADGNWYSLDLVHNPPGNMGFIDYIRGKLPRLQIIGDSPPYMYFIYESARLPGYPYFYLNENQVSFGRIQEVDISEIALIRYMPPPVDFAPPINGNTGAIMVYTKTQTDGAGKTAGMVDFDHYIFNGYSIAREFSVADYRKPSPTASTYNRTTLYWSHDLNSDSNGLLKFQFYNTDRTKNFKVIIQGMDDEGRMAYMEQSVK